VVTGYYTCRDLERLWVAEGGSASAELTAARVATAESSGNPAALSPTDDIGLWQINAGHGPLASYDPVANAKAAIAISADGTDWSPWTTYTDGAYLSYC
jgi:hypothetical protein